MLPADATDHTIELRYTLTAEDLLDGLAAQHRTVRRPWYLRRRFQALLITGGMLGFAYFYAAPDAGLSGTGLVAYLAVILVVTLAAVAVSLRFLGPTRIYRPSVRRIMRANPAFSQPMVATISDDGVCTRAASGESTVSWGQYPVHVETERGFVLLASNRLGGAVQVLPRRGLGDADAAQLGALLAAHSRRLD